VAQKTLDEYLDDVEDILETARELEVCLTGPARDVAKMVRLGLERMQAELDKGSYQRRKSRDFKASRARQRVQGEVPLDFPA